MGMRRGSVAGALVMVLAVVFGTGGAADASEVPVSGSLTMTGNFESLPDCPSFHTWHDGGGTWTGLGVSSFHLDYCATLKMGEPTPLVGTFSITAEAGTLTGDVTGWLGNGAVAEGWPGHYELTVTGGTGDYDQATGHLVFDVFFDHPSVPILEGHGTVSGSIDVGPPLPTSIGDCLHGGWRNVGDDNGQPFKNQGTCVAWVVRHT